MDPLAEQYGSYSAYHYSGTNPVMLNEPNGDRYMQIQAPRYSAGYESMMAYASGGGSIGIGSGNNWGDGIDFSDWTSVGGSQMYRDALTSGAIEMGGKLYALDGEGNLVPLTESNGSLGHWEQYSYTDYGESYSNNGVTYVGVPVTAARFVAQQGGPGTLFNSVQNAAIAWGLAYSDNSLQSGNEYGSSIFQVGGKFAYTKPRVGSDRDVSPSPAPTRFKTVAYIHSHPIHGNGNEFSDADKAYSNLPVYVTTPMGALLVYPAAHVQDGVYDFLPSDPNDPYRRNSVDFKLGPKNEPTWGLGDDWDHFWGND